MARQYTETNLDEVPQAKTSTPTTGGPTTNRRVTRENHYYTLQRPPVSVDQERVARIRQTYEISVPPPPTAVSHQPIYAPGGRAIYSHPLSGANSQLDPNMSTTAIMRNFLPPNT